MTVYINRVRLEYMEQDKRAAAEYVRGVLAFLLYLALLVISTS